MSDKIEIVYSPKTDAERVRRCNRSVALLGTPFVTLPNRPDEHKVLIVTKDGNKYRRDDVEMVFNDALLSDAVSNWGEDGPLYSDTLANDTHREVYEYAVKAYEGVTLPKGLVNPKKPN